MTSPLLSIHGDGDGEFVAWLKQLGLQDARSRKYSPAPPNRIHRERQEAGWAYMIKTRYHALSTCIVCYEYNSNWDSLAGDESIPDPVASGNLKPSMNQNAQANVHYEEDGQ